jgi:hypothetical protein
MARRNENERAALRAAIKERDATAIKAALVGIDPESLRDTPELVEAAVEHCEPDHLRSLVDGGLDLDFRDGFGRTFLQRRLDRFLRRGEAAGLLRTVEALEALGADLSSPDLDGRTAADLLEERIARYRPAPPGRGEDETAALEGALAVLRRAAPTQGGPNP